MYDGIFENGMLNGRGSMHSADGDHYMGEFKDDLRHGEGIALFANGDRYEGQFKNGRFHGPGRFTDGVTGTVIDGEWENGEPATSRDEPELELEPATKSKQKSI